MEVLDLRTYRDLQYVRNTEALMKGLDSRLRVAAESQKSLNAKSFQVSPTPLGAAGGGCSARRCGVGVWPGGGSSMVVGSDCERRGQHQHPHGGSGCVSIPVGVPEVSVPLVIPNRASLQGSQNRASPWWS